MSRRLTEVIASLMLADHLGDVRDTLNNLTDINGSPRLEGGYGDWAEADKAVYFAHLNYPDDDE